MTALLQKKLMKRERIGNLRTLQMVQNKIDFASNDYLGLARSSLLFHKVSKEQKSVEEIFNGLGSTGSRLLTGNSLYTLELENRIASFHGYEAGTLFGCGYMANVGLLSAVAGAEDVIFFDSQVHASVRDGIRLSRAQGFPFRHNALEHLENRLKICKTQGNRFICIESIYSTDGSKAPLREICFLGRKYDAKVIVDEAHATGVCGPQGKGLVAESGLMSEIFAQVVTFGKALGTYGAIVLGRDILKQLLINFATSYVYTTALPFQMLAAIKCSYQLFPTFEEKRIYLKSLVRHFQSLFPNVHSDSLIQAIKIKGNRSVKQVAAKLVEDGFDVRALLSPTVQGGQEVLRICLHAFNTKQEISELLVKIEHYRSLYA